MLFLRDAEEENWQKQIKFVAKIQKEASGIQLR